jgi:aminoglycoside phosphotransferase (APT) family kinase protein
LDAILQRHGIRTDVIERLPEVGIFNAIYRLGENVILRIPRVHPAFIAAARKEAVAVPAARAAGVRTPALLAFDDALDILPVPYSLYERVHGRTLGALDKEPTDTPEVWRALGSDLARLHMGVPENDVTASVGLPEGLPDAYACVEALAADGYITAMEARWLSGWLDRLAPLCADPPKRFLHGDIQTTNVMVGEENFDYVALIDWGSASWGDPAWDFAGVPLRAVPLMLDGYRRAAPVDQHFEARILWRHLHLALFLLHREPQPGRSWAERPQAMFIEVMRFFLEPPDPAWKRLGW